MTTPSESLSRFADADDTSVRRAALIGLIKSKELHKVVNSESLRRGLERLAASVRQGHDDLDRLLAVATLQRTAAAAPSIRKVIASLMNGAVTRPLSNLHELPDIDDRLYAAKSWKVLPSAWPLGVLAEAAAREESGEAVRRECVEGLVALAGDVSEALSVLGKALLAVQFGTKKPGDSLGRRLSRVFGALSAVLAGTEKPVGENAGRAMGEFLDRGFRAVGRPETTAVRASVVEQVAVLTHAIVRVDFSLGGRDKTYEALSVVSEWFAPRDWQGMCVSSKAISRVREDVRKSLLLLASAGKTDDRLRLALVVAAGSRQSAARICREMATEHSGIPDDVRDWLVGARKRTKVASAVESRERSVDEVLAELLIVMGRLTRAADRVQSDVLPEVSIVLPRQAPVLSRLTGLAKSMASKLGLALKWRSLRLRGTVGQEVEFSPVEHRLDTGGVASRRVRLLSPVVERISEDGVPHVVLKAPVEAVADRREQTVGASG